jgi:hypothetical protein
MHSGPRHRLPRRGPLAWIVFLLAIAATLTLMAGCVALVYGEALSLL